MSATVIEDSKDGYPELEEKKDFIFKVLSQEEEKFNKTIDQGLSILSQIWKLTMKAGRERPLLDGKDAFTLYDTYGFPLDLTKEILEEKGYGVDEEGFQCSNGRAAYQSTEMPVRPPTIWELTLRYMMRSIRQITSRLSQAMIIWSTTLRSLF